MHIDLFNFVYVGIFSAIGAGLGFWAVRYNPDMTNRKIILECIKSVSIGVFAALIFYTICVIQFGHDHILSLMLSGAVSFGGIDAMIKLSQKILSKLDKL